ncbi:MAG: hypothetical protein OHK0044_27710 [Burkholderiaceae bacterium]
MAAGRRMWGVTLTALGLLAALAAGLAFAQWRWDAQTRRMRQRLAEQAAAPRVPRYSETELAGLPPPVQRWFRRTLRDGQPMIRRARVHWTGEFNLGRPGADRWVPFAAVQDFVPGAPGFVWDARMPMAPGLTMRVRDALVEGGGSMQGALLALLTVVDKRGGDALAEAAARRYLAEAPWFPTALLPSQGVRWTGLDEWRARATLETPGATVAVEFHFDADGRLERAYAPDHLYDNGKDPPSRHPWQGRYLSFTRFDGIEVPDEAVVEWLFPDAAFAYWKGRPVRIEFDDGPADGGAGARN